MRFLAVLEKKVIKKRGVFLYSACREMHTFAACTFWLVTQGVSIAQEPVEGGHGSCPPGRWLPAAGARRWEPGLGTRWVSPQLAHGPGSPAAAPLCWEGKIRIFAGHGLC